jgi:LCP family protein required for cell wall assembly
MPRRREPRSPADSSRPRQPSRTTWRDRIGALGRRCLRLPSRRQWQVGALTAAGAVGAIAVLSLIWPEDDKAFQARPEVTPATLADKPRRPVTVLVIGLDADKLGDATNKAAPAGPANADALLLVRVQPEGPLQVLNLPTELAVRLPGQKQPVALGSLYRRGGVALTADAVRELTGLQPPSPDRYVVLPRAALRQLVNGIGGLEIDPPRTMRYQDKAQKLTIDLQGGLQRLGGAQVEQLVRYRDRLLGETDRRNNQQRFQIALRDRLRQNEPLTALPGVLKELEGQVETNLTPLEALSLMAAGLDDQRPIAFASLPLDPPKPAHGKLRQLSSKAPNPVWPEKKG